MATDLERAVSGLILGGVWSGPSTGRDSWLASGHLGVFLTWYKVRLRKFTPGMAYTLSVE